MLTHATVCPSCLGEFLAGRIELPIDGIGDEHFGVDDLIHASRVAIKPACAFNCEAYPEDMHLISGRQMTPCDGCFSNAVVDHRERLLYVAEHAIALAATGEGRDCAQALWRLTSLPWWFDYFVVFVSVLALHPMLNTGSTAHHWGDEQMDMLRDAVKRRHSEPAMAGHLKGISNRALRSLPERFQADGWRGMDN